MSKIQDKCCKVSSNLLIWHFTDKDDKNTATFSTVNIFISKIFFINKVKENMEYSIFLCVKN